MNATAEETDEDLQPEKQPINLDNRNAFIHIIQFAYFKAERSPRPKRPSRPIEIQFVVYIRYIGYNPFYRVSFTLKLVYSWNIFRRLQENEENTTAICDYSGKIDALIGFALYNCNADAREPPNTTESYNDMKYYTEDGTEIPVNISDINLRPEAAIASKNLTAQTTNIRTIVNYRNAMVYTNDTESFYIKGQLEEMIEI